MFKLAVLCAFLAVATASPQTFVAPLAYSANYVAPAPAIVASQPSSLLYSSPVLSPSPLAYSTPYGFSHLIKKRAVALGSYIAPSTYLASAPLVNTYASPLAASYVAPIATTYTAPLTTAYTAPIYSTAHLIKKRSTFLAPSTYIAPVSYTAATPIVASTYAAAAPVVSTPLITSSPIAYTHFIKKRNAPILAYTAPTSFSHQSRFDYQATSPAITTYSSYSSPLVYPSHVRINHVI